MRDAPPVFPALTTPKSDAVKIADAPPTRGDVSIAAAIVQRRAVDQREGIKIGGKELPAREQILQSGGSGFHE